MPSNTVDGLLVEVKAQFEQFDSATVEADVFQVQIDDLFEELRDIAEKREDIELINEHTRLLLKNAAALNASVSNDDEDQIIMAEAKVLLSKATADGLYDEDIPSLERILANVKRVAQLKQQLRSELIDLLDEVRRLKDDAEPKA